MKSTRDSKLSEAEEYSIRVRAYELWLEAGCPNGESLALWLQAKQELLPENARADRREGSRQR